MVNYKELYWLCSNERQLPTATTTPTSGAPLALHQHRQEDLKVQKELRNVSKNVEKASKKVERIKNELKRANKELEQEKQRTGKETNAFWDFVGKLNVGDAVEVYSPSEMRWFPGAVYRFELPSHYKSHIENISKKNSWNWHNISPI